MGMKLGYLSALLLMLLAIGFSNAAAGKVILPSNSSYSTAHVDTLLRSYAVPNAIIINLQPVNLSYNGTTYVALYDNGALDFVINTQNYTFVINQGLILNIITNYTLQQSLSQANFTDLTALMQKFQKEANPSMQSCLTETGLDQPNSTCTFQNYCHSCQTVPVCNKVLLALGGPDTPFGFGIVAFENNYTSLVRNYTQFYSEVNSISIGSIATVVPKINLTVANISLIASTIWENPIFPPTANVSLNSCAGIGALTGNVPVHSADWYCNAIGFCGFLTLQDNRAEGENDGINFTILDNITTSIDLISRLPFSSAQIGSIAKSANATTTQYVVPLLDEAKAAQLKAILDTTLESYNTTVNETASLELHITNASLSKDLSSLEGNYLELTGQYLTVNISQYNQTLKVELQNVSKLYTTLDAKYLSVVNLSKNNTDAIIRLQLEGNSANPKLSSLAFQQFAINSQLNGQVSNLNAASNTLLSIKANLSTISPARPDPVSALSRSLGSASVTAIAPSLKLPYDAAVAIAPFLAWIPALIIGIVGLIIIAVIHFVMKPKGILNSKQKMWRAFDNDVLIVAAVLLILYMAFSLWLGFNNNGNAPLSLFTDAVARSSIVAIGLNGTQTPGMLYCASQVRARISALGKTAVTMDISGDKCIVSNTTETTDTCLNSFAQRGVPIVMLTNSTASGVNTYSFYGTMLTESGNSTALASCTAATALG